MMSSGWYPILWELGLGGGSSELSPFFWLRTMDSKLSIVYEHDPSASLQPVGLLAPLVPWCSDPMPCVGTLLQHYPLKYSFWIIAQYFWHHSNFKLGFTEENCCNYSNFTYVTYSMYSLNNIISNNVTSHVDDYFHTILSCTALVYQLHNIQQPLIAQLYTPILIKLCRYKSYHNFQITFSGHSVWRNLHASSTLSNVSFLL